VASWCYKKYWGHGRRRHAKLHADGSRRKHRVYDSDYTDKQIDDMLERDMELWEGAQRSRRRDKVFAHSTADLEVAMGSNTKFANLKKQKEAVAAKRGARGFYGKGSSWGLSAAPEAW
jgi:hypothetical protein